MEYIKGKRYRFGVGDKFIYEATFDGLDKEMCRWKDVVMCSWLTTTPPSKATEVYEKLDTIDTVIKNNYKLSLKKDPRIYLDGNSFQTLKQLNIGIKVLADAQHDGHLWQKAEEQYQNSILLNDIMKEIETAVKQLIDDTKPFGIHI